MVRVKRETPDWAKGPLGEAREIMKFTEALDLDKARGELTPNLVQFKQEIRRRTRANTTLTLTTGTLELIDWLSEMLEIGRGQVVDWMFQDMVRVYGKRAQNKLDEPLLKDDPWGIGDLSGRPSDTEPETPAPAPRRKRRG